MQTLMKLEPPVKKENENIDALTHQSIMRLGELNDKWKNWPLTALKGSNPVYK